MENYLDEKCGSNRWRFLSRGSFGQVFQCGDRYALKFQPVENSSTQEEVWNENRIPVRVAQFCDESATECGILQPIRPPEFRRLGNRNYAISETPYISGGSAAEFRNSRAKASTWNVPNFISNVERLINSVVEMHALGLLHRDIKPDNILVEEFPGYNYELLLTDFGGACSVFPNDQFQTCSGKYGTPNYFYPFAVLIDDLDIWLSPIVDDYAMAVSLWEILMGKPFMPHWMANAFNQQLQRGLSSRQENDLVHALRINYQSNDDALRAKGIEKLNGLSNSDAEKWIQVIEIISRLTHPGV